MTEYALTLTNVSPEATIVPRMRTAPTRSRVSTARAMLGMSRWAMRVKVWINEKGFLNILYLFMLFQRRSVRYYIHFGKCVKFFRP